MRRWFISFTVYLGVIAAVGFSVAADYWAFRIFGDGGWVAVGVLAAAWVATINHFASRV